MNNKLKNGRNLNHAIGLLISTYITRPIDTAVSDTPLRKQSKLSRHSRDASTEIVIGVNICKYMHWLRIMFHICLVDMYEWTSLMLEVVDRENFYSTFLSS